MSLRVVFDFGAVLFRWRPGVVVARAWPQRARSAAMLRQTVQDCFQAYGGDWGDFDLGLIGVAELGERIERRTGWPRGELGALLDAARAELQPQAPVLALLLQLQARGWPLSYLSNMPAPLAAGLLRQHPLHQWFESGLFSSEVKRAKPDPACFALACERFGTPAANCLLIDDNPANIEAASACGWQAERFTGAAALRAQLQARGLLQ